MGDFEFRRQILGMLEERGLTDMDPVLNRFEDGQLDAALGAIAWWDDQQHGPRPVGPGLLVRRLQSGGMPGYKRAGERSEAVGAFVVTPELVDHVRRIGHSPNGMRRHELESMMAKTGERFGMNPREFVDTCMGASWTETPPHPCMNANASWNWPKDGRAIWSVRYAALVSGVVVLEPINVRRTPGESDWDFACRFWNYRDSADMRAQAAKQDAEREKREAEKVAMREQKESAFSKLAEATQERYATATTEPPPGKIFTTSSTEVVEDAPMESPPWPEEDEAPW